MSFPTSAIKWQARVIGGSTPSPDQANWDGEVNWLTPTDISPHHGGEVGAGARTLSEVGLNACAATLAPAGSVVVTTRAPIGNVAITDRPSCTNQGCRTIVPGARLDSRFLRYQLQTRVAEMQARGSGSTFLELSGGALGSFVITVPTIEAQLAIADFLDTECARIGDLVAATREMRSSLVVAGRIPFDQLTAPAPQVRLRFALRSIEQGWSPICDNREVEEGEWGVLKLGCVNGRTFRDVHKALADGLTPRPELEVHNGELLMSRANTRGLVGSAAVVTNTRPRLMLSDLLYRLRLDRGWEPSFLAAALGTDGVRSQIEAIAAGSAGSMPKLNQEAIKNLRVPMLPLEQQQHVLSATKLAAAAPEAAIAECDKLEAQLQEYRDALISEAVAGELDVSKLSETQMEENVDAVRLGERLGVLAS